MRTSRALTALTALTLAVVLLAAIAPTASAAPQGSRRGAATGSTSGSGSHVVAPGDTVGSIARQHGVDADVIRRANGLVGDRLYLGARLLLSDPNPQLAATRISSVVPASSSASGTYTVRDGDVLERIARRHEVKLSALLSANGLQADSLIMAGDQLSIPSGSSSSGSSSTGGGSNGAGTYTVRDGDVLERIARRHEVKLSALLSANGLQADSLIMAGDRLTIPSGSASSAGSSRPSSSSSSSTSRPAVGPDMVCPVPGASFMNDWGFPRGSERFHEGTDLFASTGTTIVAPSSGSVSYGSNRLGGTTFSLTTTDGWVVYGAHLARAIGTSRSVAAGEPIAVVGASGNAAGGDPHLHLGLRPVGGAPVNPYPSLAAACR